MLFSKFDFFEKKNYMEASAKILGTFVKVAKMAIL